MPTRRSLLAAVAALPLTACSTATTGTDPAAEPLERTRPMRLTYGEDPSQFGELTRPAGRSKGVVVVIHGGFWKAEYDLELGRPLAVSLAEQGWTAWNIEYRRVGNGGGAPATFDDVHAAVELLATVDGLDTSTLLTLGHSAGGHLAVWAAGRQRHPQWGGARVAVTGAISQAGVLDLVGAESDDLGDHAAARFLGHAPTTADVAYDPRQQVPLGVPVRCIHGRADDVVPLRQSADYVTAAAAAGGDARLVEVDGDHFVVIDTESAAWARQLGLLDELGGR
ncbi:alpha/beta hydrolase family protein [Knoellia aerolata]|uniref:Lipase/esterase n=1 Tax=Knoellia aerolata DSM 18566 TaxID=1385519 RepID=A0A0A0JZ37_9MICO|nr:alpha/beta hydrolase [Knoellia aerolata]KGN42740.1 lipase/esterase [Knoellia aerolata DSM 18566]